MKTERHVHATLSRDGVVLLQTTVLCCLDYVRAVTCWVVRVWLLRWYGIAKLALKKRVA